MQPHSDHALMLSVKAGTTADLAELFERYQLRLFNFFLQLCGNRHWAEDMVQETFVRILKYAASYQADGNFVPWMFNIARNVSAALYRKEQRQPPREAGSDPEQTVTWMTDPQFLQEVAGRHRQLQLALLRLSNEKRELILLSKMRLLGISDLAKLFDCSPAALKVRLHRALLELRGLYDNESLSHERPNDINDVTRKGNQSHEM